jgi:hypothetical protein
LFERRVPMSRLSPVASSGHDFDPGIAFDVIKI